MILYMILYDFLNFSNFFFLNDVNGQKKEGGQKAHFALPDISNFSMSKI